LGLRRFYHILKTLLQYGLEQLIPSQWQPWYFRAVRSAAFWLRNKHPDKTEGERLRLALQQLGPVWVKFGQMLSTRRDLFPAQWVDELAKLQDKVEAFPGEQARQLIIQQLDLVQITD
jgi:ubiquinone biosynthesis protein